MPPVPKRKHARQDEGGARRLVVDASAPAPTVMAGGVGSVNCSQYRVAGAGGGGPAPPAGKPPYRVPSMAEVAAVPWNGLTVASTFSGCGGSCLGYRMAGFKVAWANEFVPSAQESYRANAAPGSHLDPRDIKLVKPQEVLRQLGIKKGELDLFDGSPPCQAFSTAGKRHKGWGQEKEYEGGGRQCNETLFHEWLRLLRGLMPRTFVAENVSGLVKGTAKGTFLEVLREMKVSGYRVSARLLDAQFLGVPQQRVRVIFVGVREDLADLRTGEPLQPCHPSPLPWRYSVREAVPWIGGVRQELFGGTDVRENDGSRPCPTVNTVGGVGGARGNAYEVTVVNATQSGDHERSAGAPAQTVRAGRAGSHQIQVPPKVDPLDAPSSTIWQQGAPGVGKKEVSAERPLPTVCGTQAQQFVIEPEQDLSLDRSRRRACEGEGVFGAVNPARGDRPCPTVQTVPNDTPCRPERRKFTIAELRRICAFPDDFVLVGSYAQQWERLGNSVPPVMMFWIARTVRDRVLLPAAGLGPFQGDPACLLPGGEA